MEYQILGLNGCAATGKERSSLDDLFACMLQNPLLHPESSVSSMMRKIQGAMERKKIRVRHFLDAQRFVTTPQGTVKEVIITYIIGHTDFALISLAHEVEEDGSKIGFPRGFVLFWERYTQSYIHHSGFLPKFRNDLAPSKSQPLDLTGVQYLKIAKKFSGSLGIFTGFQLSFDAPEDEEETLVAPMEKEDLSSAGGSDVGEASISADSSDNHSSLLTKKFVFFGAKNSTCNLYSREFCHLFMKWYLERTHSLLKAAPSADSFENSLVMVVSESANSYWSLCSPSDASTQPSLRIHFPAGSAALQLLEWLVGAAVPSSSYLTQPVPHTIAFEVCSTDARMGQHGAIYDTSLPVALVVGFSAPWDKEIMTFYDDKTAMITFVNYQLPVEDRWSFRVENTPIEELDSFMQSLSAERDFMDNTKCDALLSAATEQSILKRRAGTISHSALSNTLEGLIIWVHKQNASPTIIKYKFALYTRMTMLIRPLIVPGRDRAITRDSFSEKTVISSTLAWSERWIYNPDNRNKHVRIILRALDLYQNALLAQNSEILIDSSNYLNAMVAPMAQATSDFEKSLIPANSVANLGLDSYRKENCHSSRQFGVFLVIGHVGSGKSSLMSLLETAFRGEDGSNPLYIIRHDDNHENTGTCGKLTNSHTIGEAAYAVYTGRIPVIENGGGLFFNRNSMNILTELQRRTKTPWRVLGVFAPSSTVEYALSAESSGRQEMLAHTLVDTQRAVASRFSRGLYIASKKVTRCFGLFPTLAGAQKVMGGVSTSNLDVQKSIIQWVDDLEYSPANADIFPFTAEHLPGRPSRIIVDLDRVQSIINEVSSCLSPNVDERDKRCTYGWMARLYSSTTDNGSELVSSSSAYSVKSTYVNTTKGCVRVQEYTSNAEGETASSSALDTRNVEKTASLPRTSITVFPRWYSHITCAYNVSVAKTSAFLARTKGEEAFVLAGELLRITRQPATQNNPQRRKAQPHKPQTFSLVLISQSQLAKSSSLLKDHANPQFAHITIDTPFPPVKNNDIARMMRATTERSAQIKIQGVNYIVERTGEDVSVLFTTPYVYAL